MPPTSLQSTSPLAQWLGRSLRKNLARLRAIVRNPSILPLYLDWHLQRATGQAPTLTVDNFRLSHFAHFNAFLGAWHYRPTRAEKRYVETSLREARIIFDIGANVGIFACMFARIAPSGIVYAFEPHPETFQACRHNLQRNAAANVQLVQSAVGAEVGTTGFTDGSSPASNKITHDPNAVLNVPVTTLTHFCETAGVGIIDFLKIDVEGVELDVLRGAETLFRRGAIRRGLIEVCPGTLQQFNSSVDQMIDWFADVGYELRLVTPDGELGDPVPRGLTLETFLINAAFSPIYS